MTAPRTTSQKTIMKGIQAQSHPSIMCTLTPFRRAIRIALLERRGIRKRPHTSLGVTTDGFGRLPAAQISSYPAANLRLKTDTPSRYEGNT